MLHARSKASGRARPKKVVPFVAWSKAHTRAAKACAEANLIASALIVDLFPFNEIPSSDHVIAVVAAPPGLPEWWTIYQQLDARTKGAIGVVVQHAAKGGAR